jgi:hypothetical protein
MNENRADHMSTDEEVCALKRQCVELLLSCPLDRHDAGCPFAAIRTRRDILTRVAWLKHRTMGELRKFADHHSECARHGRGAPTVRRKSGARS